MTKFIKSGFAILAFSTISSIAVAQQFKMDSNGKTLSTSSNKTVGKIDSDGRTISDANNSTLGKVDSDGKTISNRNNSTVLKISGNDIMNSSNSKVGTMSDVTSAISGAKPEAVYVALWWFIVKGNK
ncbi:5-fold beta-flower protein [Ferruginibacter sp.]